MQPKVYFVGAGPGDPDLITVKGRRLVENADVLIYVGSLLHPDHLALFKHDAERHDSKEMTHEQIVDVMVRSVRSGKSVVRLSSGDPSIYGALAEQLESLETEKIPYEIVPGVSSPFAAAASLATELTIPEVAQTVIFTRLEGRTPMPPKEKLSSLAQHGATLVLFLSTQYIKEVVAELLQGYPPDTPVAVVQKASWPGEEKIVRGTLSDIAEKVKAARIVWTALVIVGEVVDRKNRAAGKRSKLYDRDFSHGYREKERET
ncbi:MAG TPA: precorrin-4 C(11)-methyltransferase [Nitrospiria bacterium]|nr:precorrin-4 C(11)-methyltransferase [Nitrospiria bacterium]